MTNTGNYLRSILSGAFSSYTTVETFDDWEAKPTSIYIELEEEDSKIKQLENLDITKEIGSEQKFNLYFKKHLSRGADYNATIDAEKDNLKKGMLGIDVPQADSNSDFECTVTHVQYNKFLPAQDLEKNNALFLVQGKIIFNLNKV